VERINEGMSQCKVARPWPSSRSTTSMTPSSTSTSSIAALAEARKVIVVPIFYGVKPSTIDGPAADRRLATPTRPETSRSARPCTPSASPTTIDDPATGRDVRASLT